MRKFWWYHNACPDWCDIIKDESPDNPDGFNYGPFNTFTEAKKDAVAYYRADMLIARESLRRVRRMKKGVLYK